MPGHPPRRDLQNDLRASTGDGAAFSVMVGSGETYLPAFVLALGHSERDSGLVAAVPRLAGAAVQLASPAGVRRLGSQRRWVVLCATLQALCFAPLAAGALAGSMSVGLVFLAASWYWASGLATGPAWNSWISTLVPPRLRARYFAARTRICQACLFLGLAAGGAILQAGRAHARTRLAFAALFTLAGVSRWISSRFLARQSEPEPLPRDSRDVGLVELVRRFRRGADGRLILFMLAMTTAVQLSAPYFHPYMLKHLGLPYAHFTALLAASFVAKISALPLLGRLARRFGPNRLLWLGAAGIAPAAALWTLTDSFAWLVLVQVFVGAAWAAYELGTFLMIFETIRPEERTSVLTFLNLADALAMFAAACAGGALLQSMGSGHGAYLRLFWLSTGARLLTLPLLARVLPAPGVPVPLAIGTDAVRPTGGELDRPILPSLPRRVLLSWRRDGGMEQSAGKDASHRDPAGPTSDGTPGAPP